MGDFDHGKLGELYVFFDTIVTRTLGLPCIQQFSIEKEALSMILLLLGSGGISFILI